MTLQTDSIPVRVAAAEKLSASQIAMSNGQPRAEANLEASSEGIFANITQPSAFVDQSVRPARWVLGMGSLAGVYAVLALVATRVQRQSNDQRRVRRRRAASRSRKRLAEATSTLPSDARSAADLFRGVLVGFVADIADVPEAGLTASDVRSQLEQLEFPEVLIVRCTEVLQKCDHARYGAGGELAAVDQEVHSLLNELLVECRRRKLLL